MQSAPWRESPDRPLGRKHGCRAADERALLCRRCCPPPSHHAGAAATHPPPGCLRAQHAPTWAVLRTAILRTMAGALAPKEAGMDFWTLPKVSAPYLWDKACPKSDCCPLCSGAEPHSTALLAPVSAPEGPAPTPWCWVGPPASLLPVQPEAVRGVEQVLGDVAPCDVCQDVPCHHLHLWGVAPHTAGAGEASPLHRARALDGLMDDVRQGGGRGDSLCGVEEAARSHVPGSSSCGVAQGIQDKRGTRSDALQAQPRGPARQEGDLCSLHSGSHWPEPSLLVTFCSPVIEGPGVDTEKILEQTGYRNGSETECEVRLEQAAQPFCWLGTKHLAQQSQPQDSQWCHQSCELHQDCWS